MLITRERGVNRYASRLIRPGRDTCAVANSAEFGVITWREDRRKDPVDPIDDARAGTKIRRQPQRSQVDVMQSLVLELQEQPYFGLSKAIDGLHRITHAKKRASVARHPTRSQP